MERNSRGGQHRFKRPRGGVAVSLSRSPRMGVRAADRRLGTLAWAGWGAFRLLWARLSAWLKRLRKALAEASETETAQPLSRGNPYYEHIHIANNDPEGAAVLVLFTAAVSTPSVDLFLEFASFTSHMGGAGWSKERRIRIGAISPFDRKIVYRQPIISRLVANGMSSLKWGTDPSNLNDLISQDKYRAKIIFACELQGEHSFAFFMVPKLRPTGGEPYVVIIDDREFAPSW